MPKKQEKPVSKTASAKTPRTKKTISFFSFKKEKNNEISSAEISSAKVTKAPQIDSSGLSHAAQHLLLLIQHAVDERTVKVMSQSNWELLESLNPSFVEKKMRIKDLCAIHHFSQKEINTIAMRVSSHIEQYQPTNILPATTSEKKIAV